MINGYLSSSLRSSKYVYLVDKTSAQNNTEIQKCVYLLSETVNHMHYSLYNQNAVWKQQLSSNHSNTSISVYHITFLVRESLYHFIKEQLWNLAWCDLYLY